MPRMDAVNIMKKIQQYIFILIGILFVGTAAYGAWSAPNTTAPGNNIGLPIHKLANPQTKDGGLSVQRLLAMASSSISQQAFFNGPLVGNTNTLSIGGTNAAGVAQTVQTTISGVLRNTGTTTTLETPTITTTTGERLCANTSGVLVTCSAASSTNYGKLVVDSNYPSAQIQNIQITSAGISGTYNATTGQFQQANSTTMPATGSSVAYVKRAQTTGNTTSLYIKVKPAAISNKGSVSGIDDTGAFFCSNIAGSTSTRSWVTTYFSNFKLNGSNKFIVVYNPNTRCPSGKYCGAGAGACATGATLTDGPTYSCMTGQNPNGVGYTNFQKTFISWSCTKNEETNLCSQEDASASSCTADPLPA